MPEIIEAEEPSGKDFGGNSDISNIIGGAILAIGLLAIGTFVLKTMLKDERFRDALGIGEVGPKRPANFRITVKQEVKALPSRKSIEISSKYKTKKTIEVKKVVRPNPLPYYLERGWQKVGNTWQGYYRCKLGAWKGLIEERPDGDYKFFIFNPPPSALSGNHGPCFSNIGGDRFHIHFQRNSQNLDSGIMSVERTLYESLKMEVENGRNI